MTTRDNYLVSGFIIIILLLTIIGFEVSSIRNTLDLYDIDKTEYCG